MGNACYQFFCKEVDAILFKTIDFLFEGNQTKQNELKYSIDDIEKNFSSAKIIRFLLDNIYPLFKRYSINKNEIKINTQQFDRKKFSYISENNQIIGFYKKNNKIDDIINNIKKCLNEKENLNAIINIKQNIKDYINYLNNQNKYIENISSLTEIIKDDDLKGKLKSSYELRLLNYYNDIIDDIENKEIILTELPSYIENNSKNYLIFRYFDFFNKKKFFLTDKQKEILSIIIDKLDEKEIIDNRFEDLVFYFNLFMGSGKTDVLMPILVKIINLKLNNGVLILCHNKIYNMSRDIIIKNLELFSDSKECEEIIYIDFNNYYLDSFDSIYKLSKKVLNAINKNENIIMPNNFFLYLKAFCYKKIFNLSDIKDEYNKKQNIQEIKLLLRIINDLQNIYKYKIVDESHKTYAVTEDGFNISLSEKKIYPKLFSNLVKYMNIFKEININNNELKDIILEIIKDEKLIDINIQEEFIKCIVKKHSEIYDDSSLVFGKNYGFSLESDKEGEIIPFDAQNPTINVFADPFLLINLYYKAIYKENGISDMVLKHVINLLYKENELSKLKDLCIILELELLKDFKIIDNEENLKNFISKIIEGFEKFKSNVNKKKEYLELQDLVYTTLTKQITYSSDELILPSIYTAQGQVIGMSGTQVNPQTYGLKVADILHNIDNVDNAKKEALIAKIKSSTIIKLNYSESLIPHSAPPSSFFSIKRRMNSII